MPTLEQLAKPVTVWTVSSVRQALQEHEAGNFKLSGQLAEHMLRDPRIRGVLDTRVLGMLGLPFEMEEAEEGDGRRAASVAAEAGKWWRKRMRARTTARLIRYGLLMGATPGRLPWVARKKPAGERWEPKLQIWLPEHLRWRDVEGFWEIETREGYKPLTPGDGTWLLYSPGGDESPWNDGLVRSLALPWLTKSMAGNDWARAVEVYGMGIRKARVPKLQKAEIVKRFFKDVKNLGREPTIKLPEGFDVEVAMVEAGKGDAFSGLIDYCDQAITIAVLGQTLTTQAKTASDNTASGQQAVQLDRLEADAENWGDFCEEQILGPWAQKNHGDATLAPRPCYDAEPPVDRARAANTLSTAAAGVKVLREAKLVSTNEARRIFGETTGHELDPLEGGDTNPLEEPAPSPPPAAPPPSPPPDPVDDREQV